MFETIVCCLVASMDGSLCFDCIELPSISFVSIVCCSLHCVSPCCAFLLLKLSVLFCSFVLSRFLLRSSSHRTDEPLYWSTHRLVFIWSLRFEVAARVSTDSSQSVGSTTLVFRFNFDLPLLLHSLLTKLSRFICLPAADKFSFSVVVLALVRGAYFIETSDESLNLRDHYALIADVLHLTPSLTGGLALLLPIAM